MTGSKGNMENDLENNGVLCRKLVTDLGQNRSGKRQNSNAVTFWFACSTSIVVVSEAV